MLAVLLALWAGAGDGYFVYFVFLFFPLSRKLLDGCVETRVVPCTRVSFSYSMRINEMGVRVDTYL